MKRVVLWLAALGLGLGMGAVVGRADDDAPRAATATIPAALARIGYSAADAVTPAAAQRVRGQYVPTSGVQLFFVGTGKYGSNTTINYQFAAGGQSANVAFTSSGLVFVTNGPAIIGTAPPVQGVMAAQTDVFTGLVGIQSSTNNLQVVARPDLFLVRVP